MSIQLRLLEREISIKLLEASFLSFLEFLLFNQFLSKLVNYQRVLFYCNKLQGLCIFKFVFDFFNCFELSLNFCLVFALRSKKYKRFIVRFKYRTEL